MKDLVIVGAGPIGIYAGTLASLHGLNAVLIEGQEEVGGQLTALYPEKDIVDLPGFKRITAKGFIDELMNQFNSEDNKTELLINEQVKNFEKIDDYYKVTTSKQVIETKCILLTTGMGIFTPRKIGLENEDSFDNIIYSLKDKSQYKDKVVAILGGGDSAVDWALMLSEIAKQVYIIHRRNDFRAQSSSVEALDQKGVIKLTPYNVTKLIGEKSVKTIEITDNNKESKTLDIDAIFVNYGMIPAPSSFPVEKIGTAIKVGACYQTSLENVFAIGNIISYEGKVKNITAGLGEAVIAITKIDQIIHPNKNIPVHF